MRSRGVSLKGDTGKSEKKENSPSYNKPIALKYGISGQDDGSIHVDGT